MCTGFWRENLKERCHLKTQTSVVKWCCKTGSVLYVYSNTEVRSRNHCCCEKKL